MTPEQIQWRAYRVVKLVDLKVTDKHSFPDPNKRWGVCEIKHHDDN